ncbi:hypothetical protein [Streptomyces galilaeus]|uniref:hypothetical protein n=1 Tax=Streptomyces galilaeus TaxID=33899 RepID=UPI0038F6AF05
MAADVGGPRHLVQDPLEGDPSPVLPYWRLHVGTNAPDASWYPGMLVAQPVGELPYIVDAARALILDARPHYDR